MTSSLLCFNLEVWFVFWVWQDIFTPCVHQDGTFLLIPDLQQKVHIWKAWRASELGSNLNIDGGVTHLQAAFEEQNKGQDVLEQFSSTENCW